MIRTKNKNEIGQIGEQYAQNHLIELGFFILEKNWRYRRWEVDIIAYKEDMLHFVEVKTRTSTKYGYPEEAVDLKKMIFLKNAAEQYQYQYPQWKKIQFDVIAIVLDNNNIKELFTNWDIYL